MTLTVELEWSHCKLQQLARSTISNLISVELELDDRKILEFRNDLQPDLPKFNSV